MTQRERASSTVGRLAICRALKSRRSEPERCGSGSASQLRAEQSGQLTLRGNGRLPRLRQLECGEIRVSVSLDRAVTVDQTAFELTAGHRHVDVPPARTRP